MIDKFIEKLKRSNGLRSILIVIVCGLISLSYYGATFLKYQFQKVNTASFDEVFEKEVQRLKEMYNIPAIGIAIVNDGKTDYQKAFGTININDSIEYNIHSPIRVQSISKSVTSLATIKLIEKYGLNKDQPLGEYLDLSSFEEFYPTINQLTLDELLSHRSSLSLGDIFAMYDPYENKPSLEESLNRTIKFNSSNAGKFSYSNTGYNLVEWIIESVSNQSFEEFMNAEILKPLNMNDSTFNYNSMSIKPKVAGYAINHDPVPMYVYPEKASGELFSTLEDMTKWIDYLSRIDSMDNLNLDSSLKSRTFQMISNDIGVYNFVYDGYGYGFYVEELDDNKIAIAHGGQGAGVMSHFHALPNEQSGIVILTNSQRSWPMIAHVLSMYRKGYNFDPIKMESLIYLEAISFTLLGFLMGTLILSLTTLLNMIKRKKVTSSLMKSLVALIVSVLIIWALNQDYLLLTSILPVSGYVLLIMLLMICGSFLVRPIIRVAMK